MEAATMIGQIGINSISAADIAPAPDSLDAGEPPRSPEESAARVPYEELFARIRNLEDVAPSAGWKERAMARWLTHRRRARVRAIGLTALLSIVAALLMLWRSL